MLEQVSPHEATNARTCRTDKSMHHQSPSSSIMFECIVLKMRQFTHMLESNTNILGWANGDMWTLGVAVIEHSETVYKNFTVVTMLHNSWDQLADYHIVVLTITCTPKVKWSMNKTQHTRTLTLRTHGCTVEYVNTTIIVSAVNMHTRSKSDPQ